MKPLVIRGDARHLPLPDASVDLIVTSPPYFALRSYTDGGQHYAGQLGSESTPAEYIAALVECTREWMRVLKPSGSIFVNLGDKYVADNRGSAYDPKRGAAKYAPAGPAGFPTGGMRQKSLMLLPERYRIACVDELGLIARAVLVWCLSGGARVYARLPGGDRPIMLRDLVRHYQPEQVQLWNGEKWTQVRGWNRTPDDEGALELELRTGERIGCTPNHEWPTQRGLIPADELRVGDVIETTRLPEPDPPRSPLHLDDHLIGWFVGLYIAEGSRSGQTIQIAGHVNEAERHDRLRTIAAAYDGQCAVYQTSEHGSTCNLSGSVLLGILDRYVSPGTAKTKRLRLAAWQRSDAFLYGVMLGYLDGDGHYDVKNDRWRLGFTANDEWTADLRTLAARLGSVLRLRRCVHRMGEREFPGWRGEWRESRRVHWNSKPDGEVVAIRASRARDFYDLGVADEPHLFALASGVLTHNSKPNGLPESVTDRVRRSHEDWVHLVKQPRYFAAVDEIREGYAPGTAKRYAAGYNRTDYQTGQVRKGIGVDYSGTFDTNPLGKLPGSVWEVATEPLKVPEHLGVDHFAAFPSEWPRRLILGWSPSGVCTACGEGRRPVTQPTGEKGRHPGGQNRHNGRTYAGLSDAALVVRTITGYVCACTPYTDHPGTGEDSGPHASHAGKNDGVYGYPVMSGEYGPKRKGGGPNLNNRPKVGPWREYHFARWTPAPTRPATVLDPFGGTGTTAHVAAALGRVGISVDLSADYCRLAAAPELFHQRRRKVLGLDKPVVEVVPEGQLGFDWEDVP